MLFRSKRKRTRKCCKDGCEELVRNWRSTLCEPHWQEYKKSIYDLEGKTLGDYRNKLSVKNKHGSYLNSHIRLFARNRLKHLTTCPCFNCGYDKHVELCHIQAVSSFDDSELITSVNNETNIIPLCRNCHWEFDHNLLDKSIIERWRSELESNKH